MISLLLTGHYTLSEGLTVVVSKMDVKQSNSSNNTGKLLWTFSTNSDRRIHFMFTKFGFYWSSNFYCALEIGDGLNPGKPSRLAHFRGLVLPNGVTSVSNAAWVTVYDHALLEYTLAIPITYPKDGPNLSSYTRCLF